MLALKNQHAFPLRFADSQRVSASFTREPRFGPASLLPQFEVDLISLNQRERER